MKTYCNLRLNSEHSNGIGLGEVNRILLKNNFKFSDFVLWFPKGSKSHFGKFIRKWLGPYRMQYVLHNNTVLLITFINFELNPMLVNINKLKSYKFMNIRYKILKHRDLYIMKNHVHQTSHRKEWRMTLKHMKIEMMKWWHVDHGWRLKTWQWQLQNDWLIQ
jgi:hypothetical protein